MNRRLKQDAACRNELLTHSFSTAYREELRGRISVAPHVALRYQLPTLLPTLFGNRSIVDDCAVGDRDGQTCVQRLERIEREMDSRFNRERVLLMEKRS